MAYFPFFIEIEGSFWVIAGGGAVALRKVKELIPFGPRILVAAPELLEGFEDLKQSCQKGQLTLCSRPVCEEDIEKADFVIAATSCRDENESIARLCRKKHIPVNVVDSKDSCSFLFPSLIKDGPVTVGISTGGTSPALAHIIKTELSEALPSGIGNVSQTLADIRETVKEAFPDSPSCRRELFLQLARQGIKQDCRLTKEEAELIIRERLKNHD